MKSPVAVMVALAASGLIGSCPLLSPVHANTITVTSGNGTLEFKDPKNPNKAFKVRNKDSGAFKQGTTNDDGESGTVATVGKAGPFEIEVGGENYLGIPGNNTDEEKKNVSYQSLQQQNLKSSNDFRSPGSPFDESYAVFFAGLVGLVDQFSLVNSSTEFAYEFSLLEVYQGLDPVFFTQAAFDSPAALASGFLFEDVLAANGGLRIDEDSDVGIPVLTIPVEPVSRSGYQLLLATAQPVLEDGSLGLPVSFSLASSPVPEPSSRVLVAIGLVGFLALAWRPTRQ